MTGLSMRTLFEAHEQTILVAEGIANIRGSRASIMTAGDPLALIFQKLTRRRFRFADAMLAKIDAAEAQMAKDAERVAELEAERTELVNRMNTYFSENMDLRAEMRGIAAELQEKARR